MPENIIELRGIARDFFDGKSLRRVLKKMDLTIHPEELTIIAGPSGSGKTTALNLIGCLDSPTAGEVIVAGSPLRMSDSFVPVKSAPLHGADNEAIYGEWLGLSPEEVLARLRSHL